MNQFDQLYRKVVEKLCSNVNAGMKVDALEEELSADHDLLQAVIEELSKADCVLEHKSNRYGPREHDYFRVKPSILKERARLSDPPSPGINIQIVNGNNNKAIQGDENSLA